MNKLADGAETPAEKEIGAAITYLKEICKKHGYAVVAGAGSNAGPEKMPCVIYGNPAICMELTLSLFSALGAPDTYKMRSKE